MGDLHPCDLVVFAAHPDDAELTCGGLLLASRHQGWRTAVVEMTRGELGTRGTPEIRARECEEAAKILGLTVRTNLGLPDGGLRDTDEARRAVVRAIRSLRPRLVVAPPLRSDHHPDHIATGEILERSIYLAGIRKFVPDLEPFRPRALVHYMGTRLTGPPAFIVDVSPFMEDRRRAILCHASQVGPAAPDEPPTRIGHPEFLSAIEARLRHFGWMIGVSHGEAFTMETPVPVGDLVGLFGTEPPSA